jgi:tetratricopeptide (TPR) repeat protein
VQAVGLKASAGRLPLACVLGPLSDPALKADIQAALLKYDGHIAQPASLHRLAGQAYCWLGEHAMARRSFVAALQQVPADRLAALQLVALYYRAGDEAALQNLLAAGVVPADDLLLVADGLSQHGQLDAALNWYRLALRIEPSSADAWRGWRSIGIKLEQNKDWNQAIEVYQGALALQAEPGFGRYRASFLYRLGAALESLDDPQSKQAAGRYYDQAMGVSWTRAITQGPFCHGPVGSAPAVQTFRQKRILAIT